VGANWWLWSLGRILQGPTDVGCPSSSTSQSMPNREKSQSEHRPARSEMLSLSFRCRDELQAQVSLPFRRQQRTPVCRPQNPHTLQFPHSSPDTTSLPTQQPCRSAPALASSALSAQTSASTTPAAMPRQHRAQSRAASPSSGPALLDPRPSTFGALPPSLPLQFLISMTPNH
jgi:hypothetical protein